MLTGSPQGRARGGPALFVNDLCVIDTLMEDGQRWTRRSPMALSLIRPAPLWSASGGFLIGPPGSAMNPLHHPPTWPVRFSWSTAPEVLYKQ